MLVQDVLITILALIVIAEFFYICFLNNKITKMFNEMKYSFDKTCERVNHVSEKLKKHDKLIEKISDKIFYINIDDMK